MLNVYLKTISETLSEKLKKTLLDSIPSQQTTYFKKTYLGKNGRLIFDVIEIVKIK